MENIQQKLHKDMKICGLSDSTKQAYVRCITKYMAFVGKPVTRCGEKQVKDFLLYLHDNKHFEPVIPNQYAAALRFLYVVVLKKKLGT